MALARRRMATGRPVEIVSCDSMAVYRGMDIGTASPSAAERAEVPHHLIDVVDPGEEFSVHRFAALVATALDGIEGRGAAAVLVGGTGLYLRAVTDGLEIPGRYPDVVSALEGQTTEVLERRLRELDPLASTRVPSGNRRRVLRALEVTIGSGRPFSSSGAGLSDYPVTPFVLVGVALPRPVVSARIVERYRRQLDDGFVDEVAGLAARPGGLSRTAAGALGYRELLGQLRGEGDLDQAVDTAVNRTRRFAVRQERWFRRDPRIRWFDGTSDDAVVDIDRYWRECAADRRGSTATVGSDGPADPSE